MADGAGTGALAATASRAAAIAIGVLKSLRYPAAESELRAAITSADAAVAAVRGATTFCAVVVASESLMVANVGDSRAYRVTPEALVALTDDHNDAGRRTRDGVAMSPEEERLRRKLLYNFLGSGRASIDVVPLAATASDRLMLCTDGLYSQITEAQLHEAACPGRPLSQAADAVADLVRQTQLRDDATFVLANVCEQ